MKRVFIIFVALALLAGGTYFFTKPEAKDTTPTVRLGYFPNITHAAAIVGVEKKLFQNALGPHASLETKTFNAGPSLIEALFAGSIDIAYVGPSPAVNGYIKSKGSALSIIAGASSGGASFIIRSTSAINSPEDLKGKTIATPQKGGTQDVALRHYLKENNLQTTDDGGDINIVPTENANILTLFKTGRIDGAWVPEPWASRLVAEADGKVFLDERTLWPEGKFLTTALIVSKKFYNEHPELTNKMLAAHLDSIAYIQQRPNDAKTVVNAGIKRITGKALPKNVLDTAFANTNISYEPHSPTLVESAKRAYDLGFLGTEEPSLSGIFLLDPLSSVLKKKQLPPLQDRGF